MLWMVVVECECVILKGEVCDVLLMDWMIKLSVWLSLWVRLF